MKISKSYYYALFFVCFASCNTTSNLETSSNTDNKKTSPFAIEDNSNGAVKPKSLVAKPKGQKSIN